MAILEILTYPDELLRRPCEDVKEITDEIRTLLNDMVETMYAAPGIGLAASQVGSKHRCVVVDVSDSDDPNVPGRLYKLINPVISNPAGAVITEEGCLSVPGIREDVRRPSEITLNAIDENGEPIEFRATGLLAVCFQHEIDHLDGVLFIDHLSRLKRELIKKKLRKLKEGA